MDRTVRASRILGLGVAMVLAWEVPVTAQTFSSGSTGADGAFAPTANITLTIPPDGVFNFTTVTIPAGVTVTFQRNAANTPVTILATGDVTITGLISVNGEPGLAGSTTGPLVNPGGAGGPGGFAGGQGGARGDTNNSGSAGQGPGGSDPGGFFGTGGGTYGAPSDFNTLLPLFGGSGGGGQSGLSDASGSSGGGGGGALLIASSTRIAVEGAITANGANGGSQFNLTARTAGGGSGGAIRLVAPQITGAGTLLARSGNFGFVGQGGFGQIRLEAFTVGFSGTSNPTLLAVLTPGPVTAASNPALINVPMLRISAVGGVTAPATPAGTYVTTDVALPQGTTNPVPVTLTATNIPVGTVFTVKLIPQFAPPTTLPTTPSTGTFAGSTATTSVTFPAGLVSVLTAFGSFTLPAQVAALFPLIDGESVDQVLVAATYGGPSIVTLISRSGKAVRAEQVLEGIR